MLASHLQVSSMTAVLVMQGGCLLLMQATAFSGHRIEGQSVILIIWQWLQQVVADSKLLQATYVG